MSRSGHDITGACSSAPEEFTLVDAYTGAEVFRAPAKPTGPLGQMTARPVFELHPERLSVEDFIALTNDLA